MKQKTAVHGLEVVAIGETSLREALLRVLECENCSPSVSRSFGSVLCEVIGGSPLTEYVFMPARCPNCSEPITESTLVQCEGECGEEISLFDREFEPCLEETDVVLVDEPALTAAQGFLTGCGHCVPTAEMTFDYILDEVTGCDPTATEYVLCHPARCPQCAEVITEKTLVVA